MGMTPIQYAWRISGSISDQISYCYWKFRIEYHSLTYSLEILYFANILWYVLFSRMIYLLFTLILYIPFNPGCMSYHNYDSFLLFHSNDLQVGWIDWALPSKETDNFP